MTGCGPISRLFVRTGGHVVPLSAKDVAWFAADADYVIGTGTSMGDVRSMSAFLAKQDTTLLSIHVYKSTPRHFKQLRDSTSSRSRLHRASDQRMKRIATPYRFHDHACKVRRA